MRLSPVYTELIVSDVNNLHNIYRSSKSEDFPATTATPKEHLIELFRKPQGKSKAYTTGLERTISKCNEAEEK